MNYEQKYNEILEWARKNKARLNGVPIEEVLPELAESEDERIRKQLIDAIKIGRSNSGISFTEEAASRFIAWLEKHSEEEIRKIRKEEYTNGFNDAAGFGKQKEQKPAESISQQTVQGKGVYKICPRCKERMVRDDSMVYTSMPPQYRYECPKCGESECDTVMYDNPEMEEQKPAEWSDTKELVFQDICNHLKEEGYSGWVLLLNALRNGEFQPKQEWSEEDEQLLGFIYDLLADSLWNSRYAMSRDECLDRLTSLRQRLQPRPSWKPNDEDEVRLINTSISFLKDFADKGYENAVECIDWLKSKLNGNTGK